MSEMQLDPIIVGEVIARYRAKKGLTQEVLSGLADIGRTHLSAIERGDLSDQHYDRGRDDS